MVDPRRILPGALRPDARLDGGRPRASVDPPRPRRVPRDAAVDPEWLLARHGGPGGDRRAPGRHLRAPTPLLAGAGDLRDRLGAGGRCAKRAWGGGRSFRAGSPRGGDAAAFAGAGHGGGSPRSTPPGGSDLGGGFLKSTLRWGSRRGGPSRQS